VRRYERVTSVFLQPSSREEVGESDLLPPTLLWRGGRRKKDYFSSHFSLGGSKVTFPSTSL